MKISNKDGQGIVDIDTDGFLYCYKSNVYLTADWPDCRGGGDRIIAISKDRDEAHVLPNQINDSLTFDKKITKKTAHDILQILPSGDYEISEIESDFSPQLNTEYYSETAVCTVSAYLPYLDCNFVLIQSKRFLDSDRVKYYENLISKKVFPKIIVFEKTFNEVDSGFDVTHRSPGFIVDGHHKLKAYENLKIPARVAVFSLKESSVVARNNIRKKYALVLDIWNILEEENICLFIKYHPQCHIGTDDTTKQYNALLDTYLRKTDNLRYGDWSGMLHTNHKSKDVLKREWAFNRLKVLYESIVEGSIKSTYFIEDAEDRRTGNCFYISNTDDFDLWTEKIIGVPYSKIIEKKIMDS
jgi:hypothetical protein